MESTVKELARMNAVGKGGADNSMPDRGTGTGMNGDNYGSDLSVDATNRIGSVGRKAKSDDAMNDCCPGE